MRKGGDELVADRVPRRGEHDRNHRCHLLGGHDVWGRMRDNDVNLESDKVCDDRGCALETSLHPAVFDRDSLAFNPTQFAQSLNKAVVHCACAEAVAPPSSPMIGSFVCCARATSGHAAAAPPSSVMNSRRFMLNLPSQRSVHRTFNLPKGSQ